MRLFIVVIVCVGLMAGYVCAEEKKELTSTKDKISYSMGVDLGRAFKTQSIDIDPALLSQGIQDVLGGKELLMTEQEVKETITSFQKDLIAKQAEIRKGLAEKNKKEGDAFLEENKKKEGVITLQSGLQYKVLTEGTGKTPKDTDTVTTNYKGILIDGTEFDSSYKRGKPATFPVKGVIPGWTEALQLMKEGAKWQLFIPANLAYGERGAGSVIGPNQTLIFEIELISVVEKEESK